MRSTDERVAAVHSASRALRHRAVRRRNLCLSGASVAACAAAIAAFALHLPGTNGAAAPSKAVTSGVYGSIMASGEALGFIVIGVFAFALGVAVTLLCIWLREASRDAAALENDPETKAGGGARQ